MENLKQPLLEVKHLQKYYRFKKGTIRAVDDVSFSLYPNEVLGFVGESGCGKTTCAKACMGILPKNGGTVLLDGEDVHTLNKQKKKALTRKAQYIFQDPYASLDPRMSVRELIAEGIDAHHLAAGPKEREERVLQLLEQVGLDKSLADRYPHEFSGGQRQRIGLARALAVSPQLLFCDEPISALDVSVQAQIMNLLAELQEQYHLSYLFISHDIAMVHYISDRIAVFYMGKIVEIGPADSVYYTPMHPYTQALLSAIPAPDPAAAPEFHPLLLKGDVPGYLEQTAGCAFQGRCPYAVPACQQAEPDVRTVGKEHYVLCSRVDVL